MSPGRTPVTRFRQHPARAVAGAVVIVSLTTLTAVSPWYALLMLLPAGYCAWIWRSGTDADHTGVRVRALFGQRRIAWSQITSLRPVPGDRVVAILREGVAVPLPAVTADGLPRLVAAAGDHPPSAPGGGEFAGSSANGQYGESTGSG